MKIRKIIFSFIIVLLLSACSSTGIDATKPEQTANSLQEILNVDGEVEPHLEEWSDGIRQTYEIDEYSTFFLDKDEEKIEQINLRNLSKDEVVTILEDLEFPEAYSLESMLDYSETELENVDATMITESFTNYQGVGVQLIINNPSDHFVQSFNINKPYRMTIIFNEDRFEIFE